VDQVPDEVKARPPLAGLRVVELARILAGPWMGQLLADLGAEVIKVEAPEGDDTRRWGPPFLKGPNGEDLGAAYFHSCNRGKRSVVANLRSAEDLLLVRRLAERCDIFIENFKVDSLARFGLDYATLKTVNPRVLYCSVTGFGQAGPAKDRGGYDFIAQGMSGIMDLTGEPDGDPQRMGVAYADILTALHGVIGLLAALHQRAHSGVGQHIDVCLLDSMVGTLANQAMNYLASGLSPQRMGNAHPNIVPYQVFDVQDGQVIVAVGNDTQFARLCEYLALSGLASDARFATNAARVSHRTELLSLLQHELAARPRADVLEALHARGVPAGPVNTVAEAFADPQVRFRGLCTQLAVEGMPGLTIPSVRTPIRFSDAQLVTGRSSPGLGAHTAEVAAELGLGK
jgi:crotonobetainyl-CoA:carnitine CoA-transferase CaiB-like acyl-CoA transferase